MIYHLEIFNVILGRYGFQIIKAEDKWKSKYPNIAAKIDELEKKLEKLQKGE